MLMIDKNFKKESIMSKEDQDLLINDLLKLYKNNIMDSLNKGCSCDAVLTIFLANITEKKIIFGKENTEECKASFKRTSERMKKEIGEDNINKLFELAKKYNLDTFIEFE